MKCLTGIECLNAIKEDGSLDVFQGTLNLIMDEIPVPLWGTLTLSFCYGLFNLDMYLDISIKIVLSPGYRNVSVRGGRELSRIEFIDMVFERDILLSEAYKYSLKLIQGNGR